MEGAKNQHGMVTGGLIFKRSLPAFDRQSSFKLDSGEKHLRFCYDARYVFADLQNFIISVKTSQSAAFGFSL